MTAIDWRELYASNRAVIERSGAAHPAPIIPAGPLLPPRSAGAWHERTFTAAGRIRRAWVHPPAGIEPDTAVPLVCLLHGCTQDAAAIAAATRMSEAADRHGFLAVYPEQSRGENPQGCWNWFLPEHQARGAGEPASIAGLVRELMGTTSPWAIDTRRIFVAGFSAGGAMAAVLAATYPDLFTGLAVHSGLAYRSATNLPAALEAMARGHGPTPPPAHDHPRPVPSIVIHGTADSTVAPVNADQVLRQSIAASRRCAPHTHDLDVARPTTTTRHHEDGGHPYTRRRWAAGDGSLAHELITVEGLGHAWSGGTAGAPHTDPRGPDATEAIWRFFTQTDAAG